jgi:hypothetical protein
MTLDEAARSQVDRAARKNNITGGDGVSVLSVAIGHSDTLQRRRLRELIHHIGATATQLAGAAERCRATVQARLNRTAFVALQAQGGDLDVVEL